MSLPVSNWKRLASFLTDSILLNVIITNPLNTLLENNVPESLTDLFNFDFKSVFLVTLIISSINLAYWVILEYKIQQTLGGVIFSVKVNSQKLTLYRIFMRNITKISLLLLIIDSIGILTSKKKQRFTERMTNTSTVENG
ncbi:MAG: hypothetical protein CMH64_00960 [Nanoarchaeota archaeon]|nr:hypothetical protein [Nanoarchaeota archaeon]|tara:strand:- start:5576 stop:5995 length:420 start_codon:yes stop_codon:yes gene_type:complete